MEDKTKIDELFKDGFSGFEAETPTDSWMNIEQKLNAQKRRKRFAYWQWGSIAAALILAFFSGYYYHLSTVQTSPALQNVAQHPESSQQNTNSSSNENFEEESKTQSEDMPSQKERNIAGPSEKNENPTSPLNAGQQKPSSAIQKPVENTNENARRDNTDLTENSTASAISQNMNGPDKAGTPLVVISQKEPRIHFALSEKNLTHHDLLLSNGSDFQQEQISPPSQFHYYNDDKTALPGGYTLALSGAPTFAFRNVTVKQNEGFARQNINNENLDNSYAGGLNISYRTSSNWEFGTGLFVNHWQQHSDAIDLVGPPDFTIVPTSDMTNAITSAGTLNFSSTTTSDVSKVSSNPATNTTTYTLLPEIEQQYSFVEIPVSASYYVAESKHWSLKLLAGLSTRFLTRSDVLLRYEDGSEKSYDGLKLKDASLQFLGGTSVGYKINKKLQINLRPTVAYGLTPVTQNQYVETYFHQFLIYTGLTYSFR